MDAHHDERLARAALGWLIEPDDARLQRLLGRYGAAHTLDLITGTAVPIPPRAEIRHLPRRLWRSAATDAVTRALAAGDRVLIPADADWPDGLTGPSGEHLPCLWARGPAGAPRMARTVTVVGSRAATAYGVHVAADLAAGLVAGDFAVASSPVAGVNAAALRAALTGDGTPIAVLPGGFDRWQPAVLGSLLPRIAKRGLLLSAYPPASAATRARTQTAAALLSLLSGGTVLVEAPLRSLAVSVVRHAIDHGRIGMAVPGPVTSALSAGTHHVLRTDAQARLVTGAGDVISEMARGQHTAGA